MNNCQPASSTDSYYTWMLRDRDVGLYFAFWCYMVASVVLGALARSFDDLFMLSFVAPGIALLGLVVFQVTARPRCSAFAFSLVFIGVLVIGYVFLGIAVSASAGC